MSSLNRGGGGGGGGRKSKLMHDKHDNCMFMYESAVLYCFTDNVWWNTLEVFKV